MKFLKPALACVLFLSTSACFADPLFTFTLTGDGHTFQFTAPNPPTVTDQPHDVSVNLDGLATTVDGVGGYTLSESFEVVQVDPGVNPVLILDISPDPPGVTPPYSMYYGDSYRLFGSPFTTLVSDVPNPNPQCYFSTCNDLLTYTYALGDHPLYGYDPDMNQGSYNLNIAAANATSITPEPPSLLLALTGLGGATGFLCLRKKKLA